MANLQELELDILKLKTENITMKKLIEPIKIIISSNTQKEAIEKIDANFAAKIETNKVKLIRLQNE